VLSDALVEPIRVLVVDDDPRVRSALRAFLLAAARVEVVGVADSPTTAVEIARQNRPHVALVDVLLPEAADGIALLRALAEGMRIPVVATSMDNSLWSTAVAAGAREFLSKGSPPELFLASLRDAATHDEQRWRPSRQAHP
jgi:DNA-binding NarL/FixJ family response regulator